MRLELLLRMLGRAVKWDVKFRENVTRTCLYQGMIRILFSEKPMWKKCGDGVNRSCT
ncbi:hypothetical protein M378DRAFT_168359 [Amanita muscaria Koide BX008]|uniref:Uncharacterized protein n=1 Tax=Amanita muscaria (strain Koide BX008) TaxID=946122 RepID=A0A0C2WTY7_AMAMK|nr:hypothetical protein M378DRAFT_168359 [Amanita muscaria Koide BX008]